MSTEVRVPDLGDGIESGDVLEVLVSEGDQIEKEQGILELETDKATVEVPSTEAGKITKVHIEAGQSIGPGDVMITVEAASADSKPDASKSDAPEKSEAAAAEDNAGSQAAEAPAPDSSDSDSSDSESADSKSEAPAPEAPEPESPAPIPTSSVPASTAAATPTSSASGKSAPDDQSGKTPAPAGPAVRRFAREVDVDLDDVTGSGPGGRITRDDVLAAVRNRRPGDLPAGAGSQQGAAAAPAAASAAKGPGQPSTDAWGPIRIDKMPKIRRTIAAQMHKSWETCPRVTNFDDVDVTELERMRQSSKADYAERGIKLTSMPLVIKSVAMALRDHPLINASIDMEQGEIIYRDYINIGIAVDTSRGLVVPVMRNVDRLSIPDIARQLSRIAEKARDNSFSIDELRGGTFTISNLGAVGGTYSTPIINVPEVAILLIGRSRKMPVVMANDKIAVRLIMPLSISYDHRLVDGAAAARFLNEVMEYLSAPSRLLLAP